MTKETSKQDAGVALLEEPVLDERAPDQQPNEAPRADRSESGRVSTIQQGTQQYVTFLSGDEVFAADMAPVKEIRQFVGYHIRALGIFPLFCYSSIKPA
jgi:hypothetical protein